MECCMKNLLLLRMMIREWYHNWWWTDIRKDEEEEKKGKKMTWGYIRMLMWWSNSRSVDDDEESIFSISAFKLVSLILSLQLLSSDFIPLFLSSWWTFFVISLFLSLILFTLLYRIRMWCLSELNEMKKIHFIPSNYHSCRFFLLFLFLSLFLLFSSWILSGDRESNETHRMREKKRRGHERKEKEWYSDSIRHKETDENERKANLPNENGFSIIFYSSDAERGISLSLSLSLCYYNFLSGLIQTRTSSYFSSSLFLVCTRRYKKEAERIRQEMRREKRVKSYLIPGLMCVWCVCGSSSFFLLPSRLFSHKKRKIWKKWKKKSEREEPEEENLKAQEYLVSGKERERLSEREERSGMKKEMLS